MGYASALSASTTDGVNGFPLKFDLLFGGHAVNELLNQGREFLGHGPRVFQAQRELFSGCAVANQGKKSDREKSGGQFVAWRDYRLTASSENKNR